MKYWNSDNKFSAVSAIYFSIYDTGDCPVFLFFFSTIFFWLSEIKNTKTKELVKYSHNFTARLTGLFKLEIISKLPYIFMIYHRNSLCDVMPCKTSVSFLLLALSIGHCEGKATMDMYINNESMT